MTKPQRMLTSSMISKLPPGRYTDGGSGLVLVISKGRLDRLNRRWFARFTVKGTRKRREMALGPVDQISLSEARALSSAAREDARRGMDPIDKRDKGLKAARAQAAKTKSFEAVAEDYIRRNESAWKNAKHRQQWRNTLASYVYPKIGQKEVGDIDTADVLEVLNPIWHQKPETAQRIRGRIETVINSARAEGFRDADNPAVWRGRLDAVLPAPKKIARTKHHPAMEWAKLPKFYAMLASRSGTSARALQFLILTATRTSEVRLCSWNEIDLGQGIWTLPADRMKSARSHRIPLGEEPRRILECQYMPTDHDLVFANLHNTGPLSDGVFLALLRRMRVDGVTAHGFRATFKTWASEQTVHAREVIESALAHQLGDQAERAYSRGDFFNKRRRLMDDWQNYCLSEVAS